VYGYCNIGIYKIHLVNKNVDNADLNCRVTDIWTEMNNGLPGSTVI